MKRNLMIISRKAKNDSERLVNQLREFFKHQRRMYSVGRIEYDYQSQNVLTPAFPDNNIACVFSTNDVFALDLGVAIQSLVENASDGFNYDIIVLEKDLRVDTKKKLRSISSGKENVSIRILNMNEHLSRISADLLHVDGYVPPETYNKCFLGKILKGYDRCLYLDSDLIVLEDIADLHNIDLYGSAIGASHNIAVIYTAKINGFVKGFNLNEYIQKVLKVPVCEEYFQAGVLVLDMQQIYEMDLLKLCIKQLIKIRKPIYFDQCVFNSLFYNNVTYFSTAWNHVWYMQDYSKLEGVISDELFADYAMGRENPKIIHYAGSQKAQDRPDWELAHYFIEFAKSTPFGDEILRDAK